jgi:hypothetical protein
MIERERFKTIWNGVATIIFLAGIFLGLDIFGYSAFFIAIFLWATGGIVTNMVYGEKAKKDEVSTTATTKSQNLVCPSCGAKVEGDSSFCAQCGTTIEVPVK